LLWHVCPLKCSAVTCNCLLVGLSENRRNWSKRRLHRFLENKLLYRFTVIGLYLCQHLDTLSNFIWAEMWHSSYI
jgi:hypothetical protein